MSGVCSGQSLARTRGRRAGLWSPRRCAVTLGCMVIGGVHGHRHRHVVTGASPWSRGARGHRQGSGHRGGVWWSRGPRSSPIAYHLSICMSIIYHIYTHIYLSIDLSTYVIYLSYIYLLYIDLSLIICLSVCLSSITYLSTHHPPIIHLSTLGSRFASGQKASGSLSA